MSHSSPLDVFAIFNKNAVEYLVVGGTAVSFYGQYRKSKTASGQVIDKPDLDFWYNPSYANYFRLLDALQELGRDVTEYKNEQAPNPKKSVFKYELADYTLDILPSLCASLNFRESFAKRTIVERDGLEIPFISLEI